MGALKSMFAFLKKFYFLWVLREQNCLLKLYDAGMLFLSIGICLALSNHLGLGILVIKNLSICIYNL